MSKAAQAGWIESTLREYIKIKHGFAFDGAYFSNNKSEYILLTPGNFHRDGNLYFGDNTKYFSGYIPTEYILGNGDILVVMTDLTKEMTILGNAVILKSRSKVLHNQRIGKVIFNSQIIDPRYLTYQMNSERSKASIRTTAVGTTVRHTSPDKILDCSILLPPLPEQTKIAEILFTVDQVIELTEKEISRLQDLKKGMMNDLFTKGIGHTRFKDSPIGKIPADWDVTSLDKISNFVTSGSRGWAEYYSDTGSFFIRIGNLTREHINLRFDDVVFVNPPKNAEGQRTAVQGGDLLISITADLGIIGVAPINLGAAYVNQHVALVRPKVEIADPWFMGNFLSTPTAQFQFRGSNDSGAKAGLNLNSIRSIRVPLPHLEEQEHISEIINSIDNAISYKRRKLDQLGLLKKALMSDLLTGKVRVKL